MSDTPVTDKEWDRLREEARRTMPEGLRGKSLPDVLLPYQCMKYYYWLERYGMFVVVGLLVLGIFPYIMYPIMTVLFHIVMF